MRLNENNVLASIMMNEIVQKAGETFNGLLGKVFGPAADGLGVNLAQGVKLRTVENQIRGLKKLDEICKREKFPMKQVNLKVVFPYLEGIALEEEPELEDLWANLMANYLDGEKNLESVVYPMILKQISSVEAKALKAFNDAYFIITDLEGKATGVYKDGKQTEFDHPVSISNLVRLGILQHAPKFDSKNVFAPAKLKAFEYKISAFGCEFYEACQRDAR